MESFFPLTFPCFWKSWRQFSEQVYKYMCNRTVKEHTDVAGLGVNPTKGPIFLTLFEACCTDLWKITWLSLKLNSKSGAQSSLPILSMTLFSLILFSCWKRSPAAGAVSPDLGQQDLPLASQLGKPQGCAGSCLYGAVTIAPRQPMYLVVCTWHLPGHAFDQLTLCHSLPSLLWMQRIGKGRVPVLHTLTPKALWGERAMCSAFPHPPRAVTSSACIQIVHCALLWNPPAALASPRGPFYASLVLG